MQPQPDVVVEALGPMRAAIFVTGLEVQAELGVHAHERGHTRLLLIDIEAGIGAPANDSLSSTVDYDSIVSMVHDEVGVGHVELVETLACRIADRILSTSGASDVSVRITKPGAVPEAKAVGAIVSMTHRAPPQRRRGSSFDRGPQ